MSDIEDTVERNKKIIDETDQVIREARAARQRYHECLSGHGLTPEAVRSYLDSPLFSPEQRHQIQVEVDRKLEELAADERQIEEQARVQAAARAGKIRTRSMV